MKIALQLYSIKNISEEKGLPAALDLARDMGYDGVEFAGLFGLSPEQARAELDRRGLSCAGFHDGWEGVLADPEGKLRMAKTCGAYSFCIPYYNTDSAEGWREFGRRAAEIGAHFYREGIPFGFHNHPHEFMPVEGEMPIDLLLAAAPKENLFFEMDTRHVAAAGSDPVAYARRYHDRLTVLHVRDTDGVRDTAIGEGCVDFPAVLAACDRMPEWVVVENENFGENEGELRRSVEYLRKTFC